MTGRPCSSNRRHVATIGGEATTILRKSPTLPNWKCMIDCFLTMRTLSTWGARVGLQDGHTGLQLGTRGCRSSARGCGPHRVDERLLLRLALEPLRQRLPERLAVRRREAVGRAHVQVWEEAVHVYHDAVALRSGAEHADHGGARLLREGAGQLGDHVVDRVVHLWDAGRGGEGCG